MSNDRELLELAAKAAGIASNGLGDCFDMDREAPWNPLSDDGDALRLAVKLQLTICNEHVNAGQVHCTRGYEVFPSVESGTICDGPMAENVIPEDYAATRRAIVRAAAEIGRAIS